MSGIYIHVPFCKQACSYCDFHFSTNLKLQDDVVTAICNEIEVRKDYLTEPPLSLYFGGGSPSILSQKNLLSIFERLENSFDLSRLKEITLESNPDDHSAKNLIFWKKLGINRLSIGIQSFIDRDLTLMHRAHNASEAKLCINLARAAGFEHLTFDLIYGIPNQSFEEWQANVEQAIELGTDHISAYCLTVEPKTSLAHQVKIGAILEKSDDDIEGEFLFLHERLESAGYIHYEISNFAKPGSEALHNANYWNGRPYLGIGPAAHSFNGLLTRSWNVSNNAQYIKGLRQNTPNYALEHLNQVERHNEEIMTGLRKKAGVNFTDWSNDIKGKLLSNIAALPPAEADMVILDQTTLKLKPRHWLLADHLIRAIMLD